MFTVKRENASSPNHPKYGHRCYTFQTEGRIIYDPLRAGKASSYWAIIEMDKELTRYYREQFKKKFGIILFSPAFDAHISLIRGDYEKTKEMDKNWKYLDGKIVEVWYDSNLYWNEKHVWLNTYCEEYFKIREEYNVVGWNEKDFSHITVGKFNP